MTQATAHVPFLGLDTKTTHHVNWITYAHDREGPAPRVGLGEYLAHHILGAPPGYRIDLLEAGNDTDHAVDVKLDEHDKDEIWVKERAELIEKIKGQYARELRENEGVTESWKRKSYVGVEEYNLGTLMLAAHERGWLAEGSYVVSLSW